MAKKRIFAAVDIPDDARARVGDYVRELRIAFGDLRVRWERPEKLHATLRFAGDLDDGELAAFEKRVAAAAAASPPFTVTVAGTGAFIKRRSRANVLWLGLNSQQGLERLAASLDQNDSRFNAHLTIARLKDAKECRDLIDAHLAREFLPVEFEATEVVVYESKLLPRGSVYSVVSKYPFTKS